ncbi:MAG: serine hydrolase [Pseudomonadota bacterium]
MAMKLSGRAAAITLFCLLIPVAQGAELADHPKVKGNIALLVRWLEAHQIYERVPGLSVGVVYGDELVWEAGYGYANVRRRTPATADTLYSICSISKLFTSIALMQQRDAGRLQLDDTVASHLDWFDLPQAHADSGPITVRTLLTHSSGLPREAVGMYWNPDYPFPTREVLIAGLSDQETLYPASTFFQYSNLALTLVGEIAAARAGMPYAELVQAEILDPLELAETRPNFPEDLHGRELAYGYSALERSGDRRRVAAFDTAGIVPAAGFTSNVRDLASFAAWQLRLLEDGGEEVLKASTLREMQRVQWVDPNWKTTWGLGFNVSNTDGDTTVSHGGGCPGYTTGFALQPKHKIAVIVLTNASGTDPFALISGIYKVLRPALQAAAEATEDSAAPSDSAPEEAPADLSAYEGLYHSDPWASEVALVQVEEQLVVLSLPADDPSADQRKLEQVDGDHFERIREDDEGPGEGWFFERDDGGEIISVRYHGSRMMKVGG